MWSLMMQRLYCTAFRRGAQGCGNETEAYEALPLARAGRDGLLHRAVEWISRQLAAWQELQDELNSPANNRHPVPPGTPIGEVL